MGHVRRHLRVLYIAYGPTYRERIPGASYEGHGPDPNGPLGALRANPVKLARLVVTPRGEPSVLLWPAFFEMFVPDKVEWSEQGSEEPSHARSLDRLLFHELDQPRNHHPPTVQSFILDDVLPPSLLPPPSVSPPFATPRSIVPPPAFSARVAIDPLTYPLLGPNSIVVHLDQGITVDAFKEQLQSWFVSLRRHSTWQQAWEARWLDCLDIRPMTQADLGVLASASLSRWAPPPRTLWARTVFSGTTDLEEEHWGWTHTYTEEEEVLEEERTDCDGGVEAESVP